jgi:DNA polymerase-3 subunit alpha
MLEVLEQAQGAGQKAQQDALIGQGSIFDLGTLDEPTTGHAAIRSPIPTIEFEQNELLSVEKEAIGLFISAHPLKAVREALTLAVDCPLSSISERPDRDSVTIGGIITAARKIRTRAGADMMFATLDDLEGQVEIIVFGSALEKLEGSLAVDAIVTVKGRVDQKEEGRTTVVAQSVEPFRPDAEEIARARAVTLESARPKPLCIRLGDDRRFATTIAELKSVLVNFPGRSEVVIELSDERRVRLGSDFRVEPSPGLRAELEHLLGSPARLVA